jgi:hypothetical protein
MEAEMESWLARASIAMLTWCAIAGGQSGKAAYQPLLAAVKTRARMAELRFTCDAYLSDGVSEAGG